MPPQKLEHPRHNHRWFPKKNGKPDSYMGGYTRLNAYGYVWEYVPWHPRSSKIGLLLQHILVAEEHLGETPPEHQVHHIDHDKTNNRPENLVFVHRREHIPLYHAGEQLADLPIDRVQEALQGRTTLEAAKILGVHHQTLRNRFDHLLDKRKKPSSDTPEIRQIVLAYAANPDKGWRDLLDEHGIARNFAIRILKKTQTPWVYRHRGREKILSKAYV